MKGFNRLALLLFVILLIGSHFGHGAIEENNVKSDTKSEAKSETDEEHHKHGGDSHHLPHRRHSGDSWVKSFGWNILGYTAIIIPSYFIIKMVKSSSVDVKGKGGVFRLLQCCVFGLDYSAQEPSTSVFSLSRLSVFSGTGTGAVAFRLIFCVVGLQISYLTWGVLQEKVMTHKYGDTANGELFLNSEFLVFMNRISALLISSFLVFLSGPKFAGPFYRYSYCALANICSSWCQYEALKFVSFPVQVLGKTAKMIPVMLMGKVISKKTYQYYEYVVAIMISIGVSLFILSSASEKHASSATQISGLILMLGYMGFDSFTSNWQSKLFADYKISSLQMMLNVNCFSCLFTATPLIISGGMMYSLDFILKYPLFGHHILIISLASAIGQLFIFYTISTFGPLVFTTIMVTRQMISILLSCLIYGHVLSGQAVLGATVVFLALFLQIYAKWRIKQKQLKAAQQSSLSQA